MTTIEAHTRPNVADTEAVVQYTWNALHSLWSQHGRDFSVWWSNLAKPERVQFLLSVSPYMPSKSGDTTVKREGRTHQLDPGLTLLLPEINLEGLSGVDGTNGDAKKRGLIALLEAYAALSAAVASSAAHSTGSATTEGPSGAADASNGGVHHFKSSKTSVWLAPGDAADLELVRAALQTGQLTRIRPQAFVRLEQPTAAAAAEAAAKPWGLAAIKAAADSRTHGGSAPHVHSHHGGCGCSHGPPAAANPRVVEAGGSCGSLDDLVAAEAASHLLGHDAYLYLRRRQVQLGQLLVLVLDTWRVGVAGLAGSESFTVKLQGCGACGGMDWAADGSGLRLCNGCKMIAYCSKECQLADRKAHRKMCKQVVQDMAAK